MELFNEFRSIKNSISLLNFNFSVKFKTWGEEYKYIRKKKKKNTKFQYQVFPSFPQFFFSSKFLSENGANKPKSI